MHWFLKFICGINSTCFGQFLCPLSGVFHCTHSNGLCHTGLLTAWGQDQEGTSVPILFASCQQNCMTDAIAVCTVKRTPDDGQRNCQKIVDFNSKNKFEKLVNLVGFIIRMKFDITFIVMEIRIMVDLLVIHFCLVGNGHCLGATCRMQRPHRKLGVVSPNHRFPGIRLNAVTRRKTTLNLQYNFIFLHSFCLF